MLSVKSKKVLNIVLNVVVYVIFAFVLFLTILVIASGGKGYTSVFGTAFVAVKSDSMDGDHPDSFEKGALLKVKILSDEEKKNLKEGEIITFYDYDIASGQRVLNSHRIVAVENHFDGQISYRTQGDNKEVCPAPDAALRTPDDIIGKVTGKANGIGKVFLWMNTSAGFFVCIVTPSLLVLAYCVYYLVRVIREEKKKKGKALDSEERERLKQELLEELRAEGKLPAEQAPVEEETTSDKTDEESEN